MKKIKMKSGAENSTVNEVFERFIKSSMARGVSDRTLTTYRNHLQCTSRHIDVDMLYNDMDNDVINDMIVSMRQGAVRL